MTQSANRNPLSPRLAPAGARQASPLRGEEENALPAPTSDVDRAKADLAAHGYCVVEGALSRAQVAQLRARIIEQAAGEDVLGAGFHDGGAGAGANQRLWMLVNKGRAFRDLVIHPLALDFMTQLLGPNFLLSSLTANIARPGGEAMYLHADQGYVDFWTPKPIVANIAWMLDDFTEANGATRLIPGSHLRARRDDDSAEKTVAAEGPAGAALIFDGRLLHGTGANRSGSAHRHAILSYYCRPFVRQQENFFLGLAPEVRASEREALLERLGFRIWAGLGRTNSPGDKRLLAPPAAPICALRADGSALAAEQPLA
ncbi:MAG TPA: phytanoyl-CoA dioxygenase family protein [Caulobacteraceae bacterium]|nr:phytanoyl-CoA dioxygenase family protein [Caulobacteraceae bacterium]